VAAAGRLDDHLGPGAWLIGRSLPAGASPDLRVVGMDDPALRPFAAPVRDWLDRHGAEAVLVRSDRHVFGAGSAVDLVEAWETGLAPSA
jgi:3-(3-hydroxy-phenyl)propionate hydroxylase